MGISALIFLGIGLAMDAFAVSIGKGLNMQKVKIGDALLIALFFGGFQALMPTIGWFVGLSFASFIEPVDHWIAFILLSAIGIKMIWDATHEDEEDNVQAPFEKLDIKELFLLAIATSIDALAAGISLSFFGVNIAEAVIIIGVITFCLSFAGVYIGNFFSVRFQKGSAIFGGVILILIGLKTLLEHLQVF